MSRLIGIFGSSGFGREVASLIRSDRSDELDGGKIVFVELAAAAPINGLDVVSQEDFLASDADRVFTIAIADCAIRRKLFETALESGAQPLGVRARSAEVFGPTNIGSGEILCSHSTVTCNTDIGRGFHLNVSSYLAHDCRIGEFVTFGPNVICAGNVIIEDEVYVGGGAMIRQGTPERPVVIGAGSTIGMGAVVTKDVPPSVTVAGNPARPLSSKT